MRWSKIAYFASALLYSSGVSAYNLGTSKLADLKLSDFCDAQTFSKPYMVRAIVDLYAIPQSVVDRNRTGTISYEDNVRAIVDRNLCAAGVGPNKCTPPQVVQQQLMSDEVNGAFTAAANIEGASDFTLQFKTSSIHFHRVRAPSSLDFEKHPDLRVDVPPSPAIRDPAVLKAFALFTSRDPEYYQASCAPPTAAGTPPPGPQQTTGAAAAPTSASLLDQVRVRATTQDLSIGRDQDAFKGLKSATLAIADDHAAAKYTFDTVIVAGVTLPVVQMGATTIDSIPFVNYKRDYIDAKKVPKGTNINNLGVGIQEAINFPLWNRGGAVEPIYGQLLLQPQYIESLKHGAKVFQFDFSYEPQPLLPPLGAYLAPDWAGGFGALAYIRFPAHVGSVIDAAGEPTLRKTNSFFRAGISVGGAITGVDPGSFFNGSSINVDYTLLHGFLGQFREIHEFVAGISYAIPKTKYVTIGINYTEGRNLNTLEAENIYKIGLGVKY